MNKFLLVFAALAAFLPAQSVTWWDRTTGNVVENAVSGGWYGILISAPPECYVRIKYVEYSYTDTNFNSNWWEIQGTIIPAPPLWGFTGETDFICPTPPSPYLTASITVFYEMMCGSTVTQHSDTIYYP